MSLPPIKLVAVGDNGVGKTCLLISYTVNTFPQDYVPLVFDSYSQKYELNGKSYNLSLWDTRRVEEHDQRLRPLSYPNTDVILLCFSLVNPSSYENVKCFWRTEISYYCPNAAYVVVGMKLDLRSDPEKPEVYQRPGGRGEMPITRKQGLALAKEINANKYLECSALTREGVENVFREAAQSALDGPRPPKKSVCSGCIVA